MIATKTIPLMVPWIPPGALESVGRTLLTRWIGEGPRVKEFEEKFSKQIVRGRACVAVNSCTAALIHAYDLIGIEKGHEVIAPLFTCTATNEPLLKRRPSSHPLYDGPTIRFCDVKPDSLNMDWRHVESLITERTKAIVVVHYGGMPVDQEIFDIAAARHIPVVEDCAQAIGTGWPGVRGDFGCFSFQAVKHITTGDGGMLVLPVEHRAKARRLRWFGIDREAKLAGIWENDIREVGDKHQMGDIAASLGICGLEHLDYQISYRRALRETYIAGLRNVDGIKVLDTHPESACWLMTVLVDRRDDFRRMLAERGIESDQTHYRNDRYTIFKEFRGEFPNMDAIEPKYLILPMHMGMTPDDAAWICEVIRGGW